MKKFTEELTKLNTPDIRSVLRWLNNNAEKLVKPTELASMKHDRALKIIEDKYKPADIEKALDALSSGDKPTRKKGDKKTDSPATEPAPAPAPKADKKAPVVSPTIRNKFQKALDKLRAIESELGEGIRALEASDITDSGASYIVDMGGGFVVIAASGNGACIIEGGFKTLEAAHKEWPEAIPPAAISKPEEVADLL